MGIKISENIYKEIKDNVRHQIGDQFENMNLLAAVRGELSSDVEFLAAPVDLVVPVVKENSTHIIGIWLNENRNVSR